jgi:AraC-like DNA-binding protein
MNYEAFNIDLPAERTISFRSAEENEEFLLRMDVNQEMRQLRRGPFRSDLTFRSAGMADLYADRFSSACRMYLEPPPGMVGLLWLRSAGAPLLASGVDAANEKLLFLPRNTVVGLVLPDLGGSETLGIPETRFREMLAAFCPGCEPLENLTVFEGNTAELQAVSRNILRMLAEPGEKLRPEWVSNLLAATFGWIRDSNGQWPRDSIRFHPAHRQIAKRAEEYISEYYRDAVHIEDICRATGVGLRTLQRCIREYFDVTVTELVESVRMDAAHRELSALRPEESTVTQIALDNGFTHLGRFSVAYRERYGETPSEHLAHRTGQKT